MTIKGPFKGIKRAAFQTRCRDASAGSTSLEALYQELNSGGCFLPGKTPLLPLGRAWCHRGRGTRQPLAPTCLRRAREPNPTALQPAEGPSVTFPRCSQQKQHEPELVSPCPHLLAIKILPALTSVRFFTSSPARDVFHCYNRYNITLAS